MSVVALLAASRMLVLGHYHVHCLRNDTDDGYYIFDVRQPISIIFGMNVAERVN